jgi:membrane associated rhomboid family serine protease
VLAWGMVPAHVLSSHGSIHLAGVTTVITSMFLHAGWLHVLGNMLYLYIFGDNVEDRMGHGRYLLFYLLCGICAAAAQLWAAPAARIPMVGASGAIAGVMGAYFCLYPRARIVMLIFLFIFIDFVEVPAFFFLAFWFLLQFMSGALSASAQGGVAWWAHIGGFAGGIVLLLFFKKRR